MVSELVQGFTKYLLAVGSGDLPTRTNHNPSHPLIIPPDPLAFLLTQYPAQICCDFPDSSIEQI